MTPWYGHPVANRFKIEVCDIDSRFAWGFRKISIDSDGEV
jgi:hypothetical protein